MKRIGICCALLALALVACDRSRASSGAPSSSDEVAAAIGPSIYPLGLSFRDQDDRTISLDVFRGHRVIVSSFYASCPSACPLTISRIQSVERELGSVDRADLRVLLVSFDPEHDTPPVLRATAESHHLDASWDLTSATESDARTLGAALSIPFTKLPNGGFSHGSSIIVLDEGGRPVARADGPSADLAPLVTSLKAHGAS
ncbi:MAG: SCO family protein [Polyangiaceae bacterium]